jgi:hypothetical protein
VKLLNRTGHQIQVSFTIQMKMPRELLKTTEEKFSESRNHKKKLAVAFELSDGATGFLSGKTTNLQPLPDMVWKCTLLRVAI